MLPPVVWISSAIICPVPFIVWGDDNNNMQYICVLETVFKHGKNKVCTSHDGYLLHIANVSRSEEAWSMLKTCKTKYLSDACM